MRRLRRVYSRFRVALNRCVSYGLCGANAKKLSMPAFGIVPKFILVPYLRTRRGSPGFDGFIGDWTVPTVGRRPGVDYIHEVSQLSSQDM